MIDIWNDVGRWVSEGKTVVLATVVETWGSSPRRPGSMMAVSEEGEITGSVSGGCVEGSVIEHSFEVIKSGEPRLVTYEADDASAISVGLSCGGSVSVFLRILDMTVYQKAQQLFLDNMELYWGILIGSEEAARVGREFIYCNGELTGYSASSLRVALEGELHQNRTTACFNSSGDRVFMAHISPEPTIVAVGATHVAILLLRLAKIMGYHTVVVDPRTAFATDERFGFVDSVIRKWPSEAFRECMIDGSAAVCALTHDPKIDVQALELALKTPAFYIGCLGKDTTQLDRYKELLDRGASADAICRISGPIGLPIGGKEPAEIALSILAEVNAQRYGRNNKMINMRDTAQTLIALERQ